MPMTARRPVSSWSRGGTGAVPEFFEVKRYRVTVERRKNKYDRMVSLSEAVVVVKIGERKMLSVSRKHGRDGHRPRPGQRAGQGAGQGSWALSGLIDDMKLVDFKVRITNGGTEAVTRVIIDSEDGQGRRWSTVGVSANIVDASSRRCSMRSPGMASGRTRLCRAWKVTAPRSRPARRCGAGAAGAALAGSCPRRPRHGPPACPACTPSRLAGCALAVAGGARS
jgi:hypothetical protein